MTLANLATPSETAPPNAWAEWARAATMAGDWQAALERWDICLSKFSQRRPEWQANKAKALLELGQLGDAERLYESIAQEAPDTPYGLSGLASVAAQRNDLQKALSLLTRCRESHPDYGTAMLATLLFRTGKPDEAVPLWEEMMERNPSDSAFSYMRLLCVIETHKLAGSLLTARGALREDIARWLRSPDDDQLHLRGASLLLAIGDGKEAAAEFLNGIHRARTPREIDTCLRLMCDLIERGSRGPLREDLLQQLREAGISPTPAGAELELRILLALERFEEFRSRFDDVGACLSNTSNKFLLKRVRERLGKPRHAVFAERKVFGIGLTKTGTTTLSEALTMLGIDSAHYSNPLTYQFISDVDLYMFGASTDTSAAQEFEKLYYLYPNARFILTKRPYASWNKSFRAHIARYFFASDLEELRVAYDGDWCRQGFSAAAQLSGLYLNAASLEGAYSTYDQRVRHFFSNKPVEKILEIDFFSGQGWPELCAFLDCPQPNKPFPWSNRSSSYDAGLNLPNRAASTQLNIRRREAKDQRVVTIDDFRAVLEEVLDQSGVAIVPETTAGDIEGWDSLNHARLLLRIEQRYGIDLPARDIGEAKNVGELLTIVNSVLSSADVGSWLSTVRRPGES